MILGRRKWYLLIPPVIIIGLAVLVAIALPPVYRSSATILIEEQEIPENLVMTTVTSYAESRLQSINQRIMSSTRLLETINRFDLYRDLRHDMTTDEIIAMMKDDVKLVPISADIKDRRTGRTTEATIAFSLSFEAKENPAKVKNVTSQLTSLFLEENLRVRERQAKETYQFLEDESQRLRKRLNELESRIAEYKTANMKQLPEMLAANIQNKDRIEQSIEEATERLHALRAQEGYLTSQLAITPKGWDRNWVSEKSEGIQQLEALEVQLLAMQSRYTEKHPDMARVRTQIDELRGSLDLPPYPQPIRKTPKGQAENPAYLNLESQLHSTRTEMAAIERQLPNLRQKAEEFEQRIEATPRVEETYNLLLSDRANTQAKHNELLQKTMAAKMAQGLEKEQKGERFTIIDPARMPEKPHKPNRLAIVLVGIVLGVGAGVGLTALREISDHAIYSPEHITRLTGQPVLGGLPLVVSADETREGKRRKWITVGVAAMLLVAIPLAVHFFFMELDVFWAKLIRRIGMI